MHPLLDWFMERFRDRPPRTDFSSEAFEAELAQTVERGRPSAIAGIAADLDRCVSPEDRSRIADRLTDPAAVARVAASGKAHEITCIIKAAYFYGSHDRMPRIVDALTAPGPLARVTARGTADDLDINLLAAGQFASVDQRRRIVDALAEPAPLARLVAGGREVALGVLAEAASTYGSPDELTRIVDAMTVPPTLARLAANGNGPTVNRVLHVARHASASQRTRIVDALAADEPLARVAASEYCSPGKALRAALAHASRDQLTRIVDVLTAEVPLARIIAGGNREDIRLFGDASLEHGSIGERWRVITALSPAAVLPLEVAVVYANAGERLPGETLAQWAQAATALEGLDSANLAILMRRMALEAAGARGGADTVARRMLPTIRALGERPEVIALAAKYATDRGHCVNQPEATWSEMAAAVPLLCEITNQPLDRHRCLDAAGILHARQQVDLTTAVMIRQRSPGGGSQVPANLEVEFAGLVLARVNEHLPAELRLPGVALEDHVAFTGGLGPEVEAHLRQVAVAATGAANDAMHPAEAARYLLESRYAALWQEKLEENFPHEYAQVDRQATALLAHPQIEGNDDAMAAVGQWREVRRSEVTGQLTPGHERDAQLPTLEAVEARLINFWPAQQRAGSPVRMPEELRVPAALRALRIALDAPPLVPPRARAAGAAARPVLHWAAMPLGPHSRSPAHSADPRRSPHGGRGL